MGKCVGNVTEVSKGGMRSKSTTSEIQQQMLDDVPARTATVEALVARLVLCENAIPE